MGLFDDRQRAYEARFAYEEDKAFRVSALRSRMMAAWAADLMGKTGPEAQDYVDSIVHDQVCAPRDLDQCDTLLDRLSDDLQDAISAATLAVKMDAIDAFARQKVDDGA